MLDWTAQWWLCYHTTGRTSGAGTAYPSGAPEFTPVFSGVRVTRSLVVCVCFEDRCLSFCTFSFGHCVVSPSINGFWLPLWYLQALLSQNVIWGWCQIMNLDKCQRKPKGNQELKIQRKLQHWGHKTKTNNTKITTQYVLDYTMRK